jgi:hypothetical protein
VNINWEPKEVGVVTHIDNVVLATRHEHRNSWRDQDDEYWLARLYEEIDELTASVSGAHDDSVEHELVQIASICMNWLDKRVGPQGIAKT